MGPRCPVASVAAGVEGRLRAVVAAEGAVEGRLHAAAAAEVAAGQHRPGAAARSTPLFPAVPFPRLPIPDPSSLRLRVHRVLRAGGRPR